MPDQSQQSRQYKNILDLVLVSLLMTLNKYLPTRTNCFSCNFVKNKEQQQQQQKNKNKNKNLILES